MQYLVTVTAYVTEGTLRQALDGGHNRATEFVP